MTPAADGALLIKELRRARGWSWKDEARELRRHAQRLHIERVASASVDSIARTIARWESGRYPHRPDERYQLLLGHVYARRDGQASVGPLSDFDRLLAALAAFGVSGRLAVAPAIEVLERLLQARTAPHVRRRLCEVGARSLAFAGRLSFELRDDEAAAALFADALLAANEVPDGQTKATTLTSWCLVALHSGRQVAESEGLAHQAVRAALQGGSESVRARAFAVEAEVHARKSDAKRAGNALRCAERHLARTKEEVQGSFDHHSLEGFRGACALRLGRWKEAGRHLESALDDPGAPRDAVQRSIVLADRSLAHLLAGDLEAGCRALTSAVDLAAETRGRVGARRLLAVRAVLERWAGEAVARDLDARLLSVVVS